MSIQEPIVFIRYDKVAEMYSGTCLAMEYKLCNKLHHGSYIIHALL